MTAKKNDTASFDLDAARARRLEQSGGKLTFTFGGETFSVLPLGEWPMGVLDEMAAGGLVDSLRLVLGDEEFTRFSAHSPSIGDVNSLIEWMSEASTGGQGN